MSAEQINQINQLNEEIETLQKKIKSIQNDMQKDKDELNVVQDTQQLLKMRDYLLKYEVCFEMLSLQKLHYVTTAYNIGLYTYKLYSFEFNNNNNFELVKQTGYKTCENKVNISNIYIENVPLPTNDIEKRLYPHVVKYLQPFLPIKFEWYTELLDEGYGYRLRPQNKAPIYVDLQRGASLSVHYFIP